jgi:hypothetical protein
MNAEGGRAKGGSVPASLWLGALLLTTGTPLLPAQSMRRTVDAPGALPLVLVVVKAGAPARDFR